MSKTAEPAPPDSSLLPDAVRRRLRDHWLTAALDEHASIGSFARFSLHLLGVGAPPTLLEAAHRAGIDEIEHARLCFRLASAYAGEPLGPGPLPVGGDLLGDVDLVSMAVATALEGCVEETLAAIEAQYAAGVATEPAVRHYLEVIAADEGRHAELAWATVRWALEVGGDDVREALAEALAPEALVAAARHGEDEEPPSAAAEALLVAHGWLPKATIGGLRARAIERVLLPATRALLGRD